MNKMKLAILSIIVMLMGPTVMIVSTSTAAACAAGVSVSTCDACDGLNQVSSAQNCDTGGKGVTSLLGVVVNILSLIVGAVSVVMIIIAGLKYVTSSGDSNNVGSAKSTLIYALVGLAVAVLAQLMARYVFSQATDAVNAKAKASYLPPAIVRLVDT
jgi:hypothetical protein